MFYPFSYGENGCLSVSKRYLISGSSVNMEMILCFSTEKGRPLLLLVYLDITYLMIKSKRSEESKLQKT